ncbi:hypothetical protein AB6A40_008176 [Gnathostoma spinigerum]|uniref:Uncharacterized protein n=1 Tax=Gnathostoma spinigerum TaxID=75299 RepID=A0ABD6EXQ4_9BILA
MLSLAVAFVFSVVTLGSLSDATDAQKQGYICDQGWSAIPGNEVTKWGALKSMTGLIDFENVDGKTAYIYGYGYDASAYIYFESKDEPNDIPFFMDLNPYSQIKLSRRIGGQWYNNTVVPIVLRCCSSGFYPRTHYFWMIELTFGVDKDQHFVDIIDRISGKSVYRFHLQKAVTKDDRYYFSQAGYNVLGVAWSNYGYRKFESGLPIGTQVQLVGKILKGHVTITLLKKNGYTGAVIMFRRPTRGFTEVEVIMNGKFEKGGCFDDCHYADFYDYTLTIITIKRINGGFQVWHKGFLYVTMENPNIERDDISGIQVMTGFQTYGISVLDCHA